MQPIKILKATDLKHNATSSMLQFSMNDYQYLITAEELYKNIDDSRLLLFDCRFQMHDEEQAHQQYLQTHIPNAHYINLNNDLSRVPFDGEGRHPLPDAKQFEHCLNRFNMNESRQVVVYDDQLSSICARLWWMLRWIGHDNIAILDGGLKRWNELQYPLTSVIPKVYREGNFIAQENRSMIASIDDVEMNIFTKDQLVIDARSKERFDGKVEPIDTKAGHIPAAVNHPFMNNLDENACFKSPDDLKQQFQLLINDYSPEDVIISCGSGVTACNNIFAMEYAGLKGVKLFVGSWSQWIADEKRKIATE